MRRIGVFEVIDLRAYRDPRAIGNPEFPPREEKPPTFRLRHPSIGSHYLDEYDDEYDDEENEYEKDDEYEENEDQYRNDLDLQVLDS